MIKGVLFDMDGVLIDSERMARDIIIALCREMGYPKMDAKLFESLLGNTYEADCAILRDALGQDFPSEWMLDTFRKRLESHILSGQPIAKPHLADCIQGLKQRGLRIALATSTRRELVERYLPHIPPLDTAFDAMVCGTEAGRGKPAPDIYIEAARRLGLEPSACVGVEDSRSGLCSLTDAGCVRVMCPDLVPYGPRFHGLVDYEIAHLGQLCGLIDRINLQARVKS